MSSVITCTSYLRYVGLLVWQLRETLINPQEMPGYKGTEKDIDKLLEFVEGNQTKVLD